MPAFVGHTGLTLQHLEILYVGIFRIDVELDPRHEHISEDAVEDLAESGSIAIGTRQVGRSR